MITDLNVRTFLAPSATPGYVEALRHDPHRVYATPVVAQSIGLKTLPGLPVAKYGLIPVDLTHQQNRLLQAQIGNLERIPGLEHPVQILGFCIAGYDMWHVLTTDNIHSELEKVLILSIDAAKLFGTFANILGLHGVSAVCGAVCLVMEIGESVVAIQPSPQDPFGLQYR